MKGLTLLQFHLRFGVWLLLGCQCRLGSMGYCDRMYWAELELFAPGCQRLVGLANVSLILAKGLISGRGGVSARQIYHISLA